MRAGGVALAYVEKVPAKFGHLGRLSGLYFSCTGCARGKLFTAIELVRLYGTQAVLKISPNDWRANSAKSTGGVRRGSRSKSPVRSTRKRK